VPDLTLFVDWAHLALSGVWIGGLLGLVFGVLPATLGRAARKQTGSLVCTLRARFTNMPSKRRAFQVGEDHYDIGNELYGL
jgi:putative copper export protein